MQVVERVRATERALLSAERAVLTVLLVGMTVLAFVQIVLRKGFSGGFLWSEPFLRHVVLWVAFAGAAVAAANDKHFGADISERVFTGRAKHVIQIFVSLFTAVVCALLARASFAFLTDELHNSHTLFTIGGVHVPASFYEVILPVGFVLVGFHYLLRIVLASLEVGK